ncbi:DUF6188 family protein [Aestuariimicrobium sp. T2.26MG-19.2B]|uniref:DUF6188 family protein n=1 Tax=Aestuariimicrobium sp. T2.26MG-19.2B TaxID=3040679 RepID=UPI00406C0D44
MFTTAVGLGDPEKLAPALELVRTAMTAAKAVDKGLLEPGFGNGATIRVPSDENFERREVCGPEGADACRSSGWRTVCVGISRQVFTNLWRQAISYSAKT